MTQAGFAAYLGRAIPGYAADKVKSASWPQEGAIEQSRREIRLHAFGFNDAAVALYRDIGYEFIDMLMRKPL
jgi:ribosomal protein S18 acetylase RimI-like enzyme